MPTDRGVTEGRPVAKPRRLDAPAYVLRLLDDGRWIIVGSASGQTVHLSRSGQPVFTDAVPPETDPLAAMRDSATRREAYVTKLLTDAGRDPEDHVIVFLGCSAAEASQLTGIPLAARKRANPDAAAMAETLASRREG